MEQPDSVCMVDIPMYSKNFVRLKHFISHHILNQLRVFVTRSRHKCSIGLNRLRVIWNFSVPKQVTCLIDFTLTIYLIRCYTKNS
jgi:hypothetical protein